MSDRGTGTDLVSCVFGVDHSDRPPTSVTLSATVDAAARSPPA